MADSSMFSALRKTWDALRRRAAWEHDLDAELRSHIELRVADLTRSGVPPDAAERQARLEFGSRERYKDETRSAFGLLWLGDVRQDALYAVRTLRRSPGFTATAVVSLALGIGANTVVFSALNAALLRPLPAAAPDRLLFAHRGQSSSFSYPAYRDFRERSTSIEDAIAYRPARMGLDEGSGAERYWGYLASGNYFDALGLKPAAGRFFHAGDEKGVNASPFAVLSFDLWQTRFQGDPSVVGRTVRINARPYTVLGVAPRGFRGTESFIAAALWVPMAMQPQVEGFYWLESRGTHNAWMMVRLKPGVTPAQAQADLSRVALQLDREYSRGYSAVFLSKPGLLGDELRRPVARFVTGVMLAAGLVLLAACANLAGLLGARASDRFREIALRVSIGAGRGRILRQLLTESVVLTSAAGVVGCAMAWFLLRALSAWSPPVEVPIRMDVTPDPRVFLFAAALFMLTGMVAGAAPARQAWRLNPVEALKGAPSGSRRRSLPFREAVLALETALCCLLLVCSVVAGQGLMRTFQTRPGFDPQGVSVVSFDPTLAGYSGPRAAEFQRRALDAVSQIPGVVSAAYGKSVPLTLDQSNLTVFPAEDAERRPDRGRDVGYYNVSPGYFTTMGTRLREGREFDWRDTRERPPVAIVNETFARQFFGAPSAVGKRFRFGNGTLVEIVGVAEDGKYFAFAEAPKPVLFQPIVRTGETETMLLARTSRPEAAVASEMAAAVKALDPAMAVYGVGPLTDAVGLAFLPARIASLALGAFGALALMLAVTGIYGLASYSVARRVREIGIRMAIGARAADVLWAVLGRLALLVAAGSIAGLALGFASAAILGNVVHQASPRDPATLAAAGVAMLGVAIASAWGPIRRAVSLDPLRALRQE